jgi:hypothetical protein
MPILFDCRYCGVKYDVDDDMAGKPIMCRECERRCTVPGLPKSAKATAVLPPPPGGKASVPRVGGQPIPRETLLWTLAAVVGVGLLVFTGVYYWSRPFPWEIHKAAPRDKGPRDGFGPPRDGPPGKGPPGKGPPGGQMK